MRIPSKASKNVKFVLPFAYRKKENVYFCIEGWRRRNDCVAVKRYPQALKGALICVKIWKRHITNFWQNTRRR